MTFKEFAAECGWEINESPLDFSGEEWVTELELEEIEHRELGAGDA